MGQTASTHRGVTKAKIFWIRFTNTGQLTGYWKESLQQAGGARATDQELGLRLSNTERDHQYSTCQHVMILKNSFPASCPRVRERPQFALRPFLGRKTGAGGSRREAKTRGDGVWAIPDIEVFCAVLWLRTTFIIMEDEEHVAHDLTQFLLSIQQKHFGDLSITRDHSQRFLLILSGNLPARTEATPSLSRRGLEKLEGQESICGAAQALATAERPRPSGHEETQTSALGVPGHPG